MFQVGDMIKQNIDQDHSYAYYGIVVHVDIEKDEVIIDWLDWGLVKPTTTTQHIARLIWIKVNE